MMISSQLNILKNLELNVWARPELVNGYYLYLWILKTYFYSDVSQYHSGRRYSLEIDQWCTNFIIKFKDACDVT